MQSSSQLHDIWKEISRREPPLDEPVQPCLLNHVRMSDICGFTDIQNIVEWLISDFIPKKSEISKFSNVEVLLLEIINIENVPKIEHDS